MLKIQPSLAKKGYVDWPSADFRIPRDQQYSPLFETSVNFGVPQNEPSDPFG